MKKNETDNQKDILCKIPCWAFGIKIPWCKYIIYNDAICTTKGIFSHSVKFVPLHRIDTKEYYSSAISRLFGCGCIQLTLRGFKEDNVSLYVRHPQMVIDTIERAISNEKNEFYRDKANRQSNYKGVK